MSLPILAFSFVCHTTLIPIYKELPGNCLKRMKRVVAYAFIFCSAAYFLVGVLGYMSFSTDVETSILDNYAAQVTKDCHRADPFGPMIITIKLLFAISILLTIPLVHFPCRQVCFSILIDFVKAYTVYSPAILTRGRGCCKLFFFSLSLFLYFVVFFKKLKKADHLQRLFSQRLPKKDA